MIKKMMSYVLGMVFVVVAFVAVFATASFPQKVYASSISDPLVIALNTSKVDNQTVRITARVEQNTGLCGLELHLASTSAFSITESGNDLSILTYEGDASTGIYTWGPAAGSPNVKATGNILTLTLRLTGTASDGTYNIRFNQKIACYNNGSKIVNKAIAIQSAKIMVESGKIAGTESYDEANGLPTWAIILIALGGVAVVGGATTLIVVKSKKKPKNWKEVK